MKNKMMKVSAGIVLAAIIFTTGINVSPAFASAMERIPAVGKVVRKLYFDNGKTDEGKITKEYENIFLNFSKDEEAQDELDAYQMSYYKSLNLMYFQVDGFRRAGLSQEEIKELKENELIKDVYRVTTLDDSLVRFVIQFNKPIDYKVEEMNKPVGLKIQFKEDREFERKESFILRTESMENGEGIAILEERFMGMDSKILKDRDGKMFIYLGSYDTKEKAQSVLEKVQRETGEKLIIVKNEGDKFSLNREK